MNSIVALQLKIYLSNFHLEKSRRPEKRFERILAWIFNWNILNLIHINKREKSTFSHSQLEKYKNVQNGVRKTLKKFKSLFKRIELNPSSNYLFDCWHVELDK